nr:hypothetical protein [Roseospira goensis]
MAERLADHPELLDQAIEGLVLEAQAGGILDDADAWGDAAAADLADRGWTRERTAPRRNGRQPAPPRRPQQPVSLRLRQEVQEMLSAPDVTARRAAGLGGAVSGLL